MKKIAKKVIKIIFNKLGFNIIKTRNHESVVIKDYKYTPKHRISSENSKIVETIENWYKYNHEEIIKLHNNIYSLKNNFFKIPINATSDILPHWSNDFISPFDAISIYGFLALYNPRYYVEVGSGNTTLFAAQSIRDNNLRTKIISIDPFPRAEIDKICSEIFRLPLEDMELDFFSRLSSEDILLIDNSHRSFPNSDVTVFFTEILPNLPSGILYTLHDIFLPSDYPEQWSSIEKRWYNEQYLLCAYLLGGGNGDKIICPNYFLSGKEEIFEIYKSLWSKKDFLIDLGFGGGFFWMKKN